MGTNDHDSVDVLSWKEEMVNTGCVDTAVKGLGEGRAIEGENIVYIGETFSGVPVVDGR